MSNAIDALDNGNKPIDSIDDDVNGYGSLLYGPQQSGVHNQWSGNFTDFIMNRDNLDPYTQEMESNNRTSEEYGMTEDDRMQDESDKMGLYGTTDLDKIKGHNKWAGRLAGGDNYEWKDMKQNIGQGMGELGKGLMGLSGKMGNAFQYDEIG